ncbi:serine carboxypeptidase family protein [Trifolium medium]|uniref:Serine carboxypeptidase family protein n=1 Tax=Trifolium medium TaxID=97028 RepID=A0A392QAT4_9FABA|nr:serine carboxypeptidase family protein [Trifolium medium]
MYLYRKYTIRVYLLFLVDTTIFSDKSKMYVDVTYLLYFRDPEIVDNYTWVMDLPPLQGNWMA